MSALLTKAFEKWVAECAASNLPARPDSIVFALMEREPSRDDEVVPPEKITHTVNNLHYGKLDPNSIVCSAVVADNETFTYDWICLVHQPSNTLCGVIKTPVRHKLTGETLIRNFAVIYSGLAQAAHITVPPESWQLDLFPELNKKAPLHSPSLTGEPTTPTPPEDAADTEIANAKFVRKLLKEMSDSLSAPSVSGDPKNLLKTQSGALFVDGAHSIIPKMLVSTMNSNLDSFKSLPDGSRVYTLKLDVSNPIGQSSVGGIGIAVSAMIEPRYLYQNQNRQYIPAQYFVGSVSANTRTITIGIQVVMPDKPYYALDMSTLKDIAGADDGPLPCVVVIKTLAGTTLRQNGMG
ncbi:hypothetical protein G6K26_000976 [Escherichia coli]|uniref:phage tail-collar fiber domain-containing protein n=1 Tax=Escherichia coli TaxID=562 RepID=UPI000BB6C3D3|nr:phage tail protein [Escherichia coli]EFK5223335.1 hypothetical protein [Escherichia coli]